MKKTAIILVIIATMILFAGATSIRSLHPQTPIFEEPDFSSAILFKIPQNAQVIAMDEDIVIDNTNWLKIKYGSYVGYVDASSLYEEENQLSINISQIKATSKT